MELTTLRSLLLVTGLYAVTVVADAVPALIKLPANASAPILESFVSFSIEFSSFPVFAGNSSNPNNFSYTLLKNLGEIQGTNPIIRVGGNTQDYATFNASQEEALIGSFNFNRSYDYPTTISIGPSYFDSYSTWPGIKFLHGFNLGKNGSAGYNTLLGTVPLVCKALGNGSLAYWQYGNEPDLFSTSSQGPVRPINWNDTEYVAEWLNGTRTIRALVEQNCPEVIEEGKFKFYAPSFAGTGNKLNQIRSWKAGLDNDSDIAFIDSHNYIGGATQPGVTLQGTLMNHTSNTRSIGKHLNESSLLAYTGLPYILGETNSLYNEGAPGLSNSFGAALWGVDFNLYCAATGIHRVHMHQGSDYRYQSWQPIDTKNTTMGTKAPYYGNIAVATMLGDLTAGNVTISDIELGSIHDIAYAAYLNDRLQRIAVIQLNAYNYTNNTQGERPSQTYTFQLPETCHSTQVGVQRLIANGSDAITGITFDGYSYNYELNEGLPVLLNNVTRGEVLQVGKDGTVSVDVPWSSAVILNINHWAEWE